MSAIIESNDIQKEMETNLQNRIQCIPYLGWLLTNIVHWKDYKSLRLRSESFSKETIGKKWSHRASVCTVSMPTSPVNEDNSTLLHNSETISRSLCDMLQVNKTATVTHPLFLSVSPPSQEFLQVKAATNSTSDSDSSMKADSAIGLDSSMSQASPERKSEAKKEHNEEAVVVEEDEDRGNYCLPVLEQSFDDSETEEDCLSSLSSSTLSLTSPFTALPSAPQKRRVTLPIHPPSSSPPPRAEVCLHYDTTGTLFSSCPVDSSHYDFNESTIYRLSAVARQLLIQSNEESSTDSTSKEAVNEKDESSDVPGRDAILTLFEQYQVNTLSYLTDYSSNAKMRHLIMEAPWIDDGVCHAVSLQVEP